MKQKDNARTISVIVANYNRNEEIQQLAAMLYGLRQLICELIIIDDASTINPDVNYDGIQRAYPEFTIKIIRHDVNRGPAASRNSGIVAARGDMLLFIDSDVRCGQDCIRLLHDCIGPYHIAFPTILYDDNTRKNPQNYQFNQDHCMDSAMFMIKKKALDKMDSYFDKDLRIGEDCDFFLRAYIFGLAALYVKEAGARHPVRTSFTANDLREDLQYPLYAKLKVMGMCKYHIPWLVTIAILLVTHFIGAVSRKRVVLFSNIKPVRYSASRISLVKAYLAAISWNIARTGDILRKRRKLRKAIRKYKEA
ncbi:glycosyltransferase family 2 protein [Verrucomicrobiota bacterium]